MDMELRFIPLSIEAVSDGEMVVSGYVNKTEQWSHTLGQRKKFKEKVSKGAFNNSLAKRKDVNLLYEHNPMNILSSTKNGMMELVEDEIGLKIRAKIVATSLGKDVFELVKSGIVTGMSFGMKVLKDSWKKLNDGSFLRVIDELDLIECTITENPAYPQSVIAARGINVIENVVIPDDIEEEIEERSVQEILEAIKNLNEKLDGMRIQEVKEETPSNDVSEEPITNEVEEVSTCEDTEEISEVSEVKDNGEEVWKENSTTNTDNCEKEEGVQVEDTNTPKNEDKEMVTEQNETIDLSDYYKQLYKLVKGDK